MIRIRLHAINKVDKVGMRQFERAHFTRTVFVRQMFRIENLSLLHPGRERPYSTRVCVTDRHVNGALRPEPSEKQTWVREKDTPTMRLESRMGITAISP
jgi:hypothetical protein